MIKSDLRVDRQFSHFAKPLFSFLFLLIFLLTVHSSAFAASAFTDGTATYGIADGTGSHSSSAWVDIDNDGDLDLYSIQNCAVKKLYQNNGVGVAFTDATATYGISDGTTCSYLSNWIDFDNDGDMDLFLANWEDLKLYRNNGVGIPFTNVTATYAIIDGHHAVSNVTWVDVDNDGDLDAYISRGNIHTNMLYLNNGVGVAFTDATATYGIADGTTTHLSSAWIDVDNDGDLDLYSVNRDSNNKLYLNNGVGVAFTDATATYGIADGTPQHYSSSWIDIDNDGDLDLYSVNYQANNKLYLNNGVGVAFTDATATYGIADGTANHISSSWIDIDNDGDLDLYSVSPYVNNKLYLNNGVGVAFTDATNTYGIADGTTGHVSSSWIDIDDDGDLDLYSVNGGSNNKLYLNPGQGSNYLKLVVNNAQDRYQYNARVEIDRDGNGDFSPSGNLLVQYQSTSNYGGITQYNTSQDPVGLFFGLGTDSSCKYDVRIYLTPLAKANSTPSYTYSNVCPNQTLNNPSGSITMDSTAPALTLSPISPDPTTDTSPSLVGIAVDALSKVASVEYQMDATSGSWIACTADDGAFDEASEAFTCSVTTALSTNANHTMYVRATDNASNPTTAGSEASDAFTVSGLAVIEPEVTPNLSPSGVSDPNNTDTAVLGEKIVTSSDEVSVNWDRPDDTSNIDEYVVHYREIGSSTWKTESAGPDADSISWDPGEGNWEWYLEIVYTDGSTSETSIYKFEVDQSSPENQLISIADEQIISFTDDQNNGLLLPFGTPLIFNFGNTDWDTVIEIWNWDKTIHYTTMVCGSGICDHGDILTGPLTLVIYTVDEAGNESERREIKITPFGFVAGYVSSPTVNVPTETSANAAVRGVTSQLPANSSPSSSAGRQLASGIVRGAVDVDTSLNPSAIKNPGIVNGAVDVAPVASPEPTQKQNILQRILGMVFK